MSENQGIFTSAAVKAYLSADATVSSEQLSDRLWTVSDGKYRSIFVEAESSVVAFDTFGTPARARAYAAEISRCIPDKPVSTVIYTHDHLDHAGFAADFAPDAKIVADEMTAKVVALRNADGQLAVSDALSGREHKVNFDGAEFVLLNRGPVHGTGRIFRRRETIFFQRHHFAERALRPNAGLSHCQFCQNNAQFSGPGF
jgi:glyoxylase-like metal-dependent hydrolase (beta-lactamase superfamily II)